MLVGIIACLLGIVALWETVLTFHGVLQAIVRVIKGQPIREREFKWQR